VDPHPGGGSRLILESLLLSWTAAQVATELRQRTQLLAEKGRALSREERGDILRELHQLRTRYVDLRGGDAAHAELA
jgi:hypothetical protein